VVLVGLFGEEGGRGEKKKEKGIFFGIFSFTVPVYGY
jgi:hypothetical protein